jgi:hypothetical protein
MQSGAMPQYEFPVEFLQRYRTFLSRHAGEATDLPGAS